MTYSEFIASTIRLEVVNYFRQQAIELVVQRAEHPVVLQAAHLFSAEGQATDALKPIVPQPIDSREVAAPTTLHVLVVDDVLMIRDIASSFLRAAGHQVMCVEGGPEAIAAVNTKDFDVVLMDVRMPVMNGFEATRRIRALEGKRGQVPIVALTALAFPEQVEECYEVGMNSHLPKPFNPNTLHMAVMRAVDPHRTASSRSLMINRVIGLDSLVFNQSAFLQTALHLESDTVSSYLGTILEHGASLLRDLRAPDAVMCRGRELADAAHTIAGSAGMLGFERLTAVGRQFERAIRSNAADTPALADGLSTTLKVTLQTIQERVLLSVDE